MNSPPDTRAWKLQVWVSFGPAVGLCAVGLAYLPGEDLHPAFMVLGHVFWVFLWLAQVGPASRPTAIR